jgi:hypothetical protein
VDNSSSTPATPGYNAQGSSANSSTPNNAEGPSSSSSGKETSNGGTSQSNPNSSKGSKKTNAGRTLVQAANPATALLTSHLLAELRSKPLVRSLLRIKVRENLHRTCSSAPDAVDYAMKYFDTACGVFHAIGLIKISSGVDEAGLPNAEVSSPGPLDNDVLELNSDQDRMLANVDEYVDRIIIFRNTKRRIEGDEEDIIRELCSKVGIVLPESRFRPLAHQAIRVNLMNEGCLKRHYRALHDNRDSRPRARSNSGKKMLSLFSPRMAGNTPTLSYRSGGTLDTTIGGGGSFSIQPSHQDMRLALCTSFAPLVTGTETMSVSKELPWHEITESMKDVMEKPIKPAHAPQEALEVNSSDVLIPGVTVLPLDWDDQFTCLLVSRGDDSSSEEDTDDEHYDQLHTEVLENIKVITSCYEG